VGCCDWEWDVVSGIGSELDIVSGSGSGSGILIYLKNELDIVIGSGML